MSVQIQPVTSARQRHQFLEFPWQLYRDDPLWVPPLRSEQKQLCGFGRHPFFRKNAIQTFLALRDGQVCGRIAAVLNQVFIETHQERRGFFGFFECVEDEEVARALFDAARQWLSEHDIHCLRGPVSPGLNYSLGTLIDGFDLPPLFLMPYGPRYYPRLIESYGFRKTQDLYAYYGHVDMLPKSTEKLAPLAEQITDRYNIRVRQLDKKRLYEDVLQFISIYNASLVNTWGYDPMSDEEVKQMAKGLKHLLVPAATAAAEIDGRMVGAAFGLPDYNPCIKAIDGRLFPFGFLRLLAYKRKAKRYRLLAANVIPEYQLMGVGLVLLRSMVPIIHQWNLEELEYSWISESNPRSWRNLEKGGAKRYKTYRVYDFDP